MKNILLVITAAIFILSCKDIPSDKQTNAAQQAEQNQAGSSSGSNGGSSAGGSSGSLAQQGGSGGGSGGAESNSWGGGSGGWAQNNNPCQAVDERSGTFDESTKKQELFKRLADAALRFEDHVCVGDLHISNTGNYDETPEYKDLYAKFLDEYPFIFHLNPKADVTTTYKSSNENEVSSYKLDYFIKPENIVSEYTPFEKILEEFYGLLKEGMDDAEISYVLYSELAKRTYYKELYNDNARTALGAFVDKHAVCEGYSRSYKLLTDGLGIETSYVTGRDDIANPRKLIGHAWNRIKLGGAWYNVDATWDDYTTDDSDKAKYGMSAYTWGKYFLTSDGNFYNTQNHPRPYNHPEYKNLPQANSDTYNANAVFRDGINKTQPFFHSERWYYFSLTDYTFYSSKFDGNDKKQLHRKNYANKPNPSLYKVASRVKYGTDKIYFLDMAENDKFWIFSMGYDGQNLQKVREAPSPDDLMKYQVTAPSEDPGVVALRGELMLSKMKDAYFHGKEDLSDPKDAERQAFVKAIKDAQDLIKSGSKDNVRAKDLYNKLKDLRQKANKKTTKP
ncbi:MAG: transglutaminase domain-containing protein [Helicobacteraceae bacterium]